MGYYEEIDGICRKIAAQEVAKNLPHIKQNNQATAYSGPCIITSVYMKDGQTLVTVCTQDNYLIKDVQPGSQPVGPGVRATISAGVKLTP